MTAELKLSLQRERFRVRYALAAASVHEALTLLAAARDEQEGGRLQAREGGTSPVASDGVLRATALLDAASEQVRNAVGDAEKVVEGLREPSVLADSVRAFLDHFLIPSMQVLRGGIVLELRRLGAPVTNYAEADEAKIDTLALQPGLSWRVRYNLACFYASALDVLEPSEMAKASEPRTKALVQLQAALASAPSTEVVRLALWASLDPSLAGVRRGSSQSTVERLLAHYSGAPLTPAGILAELDGVGAVGAEALGRLGLRQPSDLPAGASWESWAQALGTPVDLTRQWLERVDLAAVEPLRIADVNALIRAGIRATVDLASAENAILLAELKALGDRAPADWSVPTGAVLDHWIMAAGRRFSGA